ncbi:MAG: lytic murein transglycosylase [Mesorhizobium sp.]|nr:MAG: lytic murein transglycosylase [Mesorhizobium sp.]TJU98475.1 MAG: lytic murein transglycosylase [Mesorhizobium sp.]TJV18806.1 MAG: lytic murein transglycosylase [Mesorhizobium sp.]
MLLGREALRPGTPLCPAGHLPRKGGDWLAFRISPTFNAARFTSSPKLLISPLAGEMPGRAEGGA